MESTVKKIYTRRGRNISFGDKLVVYNLGCGDQRYRGVIGVDIVPTAELVCDLDLAPWPIGSSSADIVMSFHTFEHLSDMNEAMDEVYRILKPDGRFIIEVPYFRSVGAFQDPTHTRFFTGSTMGYFYANEKRETSRYGSARFRLIGRWYGWPAHSRNPFVEGLKRFANSFPHIYDQYVSLIFPARIIIWELEAIKE
jgi:SAM-dependent methyltransferase